MATDLPETRQVIRSEVLSCVKGVLRSIVSNRSRGLNDGNAVDDAVDEPRTVYAARKKARVDRLTV